MLINNVPGLPKGIVRSIDMTSTPIADLNTLIKDGLYEISMNSSTLNTPISIIGSLVYTATVDVHTYQAETENSITQTIKFVGATSIYTYYRTGTKSVDTTNWSSWRKEVEDIPVFTAATEDENGVNGLVPAPTTDDDGKFLRSDGTWASVSATADSVVAALGYTPSKVTVSDEYILTVDGWSDNTQTLSIPHDVNDLNNINVIGSYMSEWFVSGVYADSETDNTIAFKCNTVPTTELKFKLSSSTVS